MPKFKKGDVVKSTIITTGLAFTVKHVDMVRGKYELKEVGGDYSIEVMDKNYDFWPRREKPATFGYFKWITMSAGCDNCSFGKLSEYETEEEARKNSVDGVIYKVVMKVVKRVTTTWECVNG